MTRPPLPVRYSNPCVKSALESGVLPPVKYQILNCQGKDILVGRMKIDTPTDSGHAFILRRFDTGAISLTTMFRAAFPNAPEQDEKDETQWVKDNHDLSGNNGGARDPAITRLAGTWIDTSLARTLGADYRLGPLISAVVEATPDPAGSYRRSAKGPTSATNQPSPRSPNPSVSAQAPVKQIASPTPAPAPTKRRKEASPAPSETKPAPRRSTRAKSPPLKTPSIQSLTAAVSVSRTPAKTRRKKDIPTPGGSDETVVEEDAEVEDVAADDLHQQDIAEQKALINGLKKEAAKKKVSVGPAAATPATKVVKRIRVEEEPMKFDFKEPEVGQREIATNNRVGRFHLQPQNKAAVWGVAAFVFGAGAIAFLPNFL